MSAELLFCLTSLLFLGWVISLKHQIMTLREENQRLQDKLRSQRAARSPVTEISRHPEVWKTHPQS